MADEGRNTQSLGWLAIVMALATAFVLAFTSYIELRGSGVLVVVTNEDPAKPLRDVRVLIHRRGTSAWRDWAWSDQEGTR